MRLGFSLDEDGLFGAHIDQIGIVPVAVVTAELDRDVLRTRFHARSKRIGQVGRQEAGITARRSVRVRIVRLVEPPAATHVGRIQTRIEVGVDRTLGPHTRITAHVRVHLRAPGSPCLAVVGRHLEAEDQTRNVLDTVEAVVVVLLGDERVFGQNIVGQRDGFPPVLHDQCDTGGHAGVEIGPGTGVVVSDLLENTQRFVQVVGNAFVDLLHRGARQILAKGLLGGQRHARKVLVRRRVGILVHVDQVVVAERAGGQRTGAVGLHRLRLGGSVEGRRRENLIGRGDRNVEHVPHVESRRILLLPVVVDVHVKVHAVLQQQGHVLPGHAERKFESIETGQPLKVVLVIGGIVGVNGRLDTLKHLVRVLLGHLVTGLRRDFSRRVHVEDIVAAGYRNCRAH